MPSKVRELMVGGPSIVFPRKIVADESHIRKSINACKSIGAIDASQLEPYSMCQPMSTGLCKICELDADLQRLNPCANKSKSIQYMLISNQ